ncbi:MAG: SfiI family type II restriction endonuclease [Acidaminococcales bacterium]|jgi:hypothetical protein|nr:SfiI family type II restriction endonuclease [Acidaminococcales bacterium]
MFVDARDLSLDEIENIEKLTLRWLVQATMDFGFDAYDIFYYSPDSVKDVAEDITREIVDRLPGYNTTQRIFGTVDYKKARYIILPNQIVRQALFVDSKAEKTNQTATLQISQTSLEIRQMRSGSIVNVQGRLPAIYPHDNNNYLSTTLLLHYCYEDIENRHFLKDITVCCVPNGLLQERYNPTPERTFWVAGRNAPSLGEEFRTRISFARLIALTPWRVQRINIIREETKLSHSWQE